MAKAVLVMDMPEDCNDCYAMYVSLSERFCRATEENLSAKAERPDWCPLRELPEKIPELESGYESINRTLHREGWNDCLDRILGELPEKGGASKRGNPAG